MAGKKTSEIAQALNVSRSQAFRILRAEETQQILVQLVNERIGRAEALLDRAFQAIEEAFTAERTATQWDAGGPDHYARLAAANTLGKMLTAGRPKPKAAEPQNERRGMTLAELTEKVESSPLVSPN